MNYEESMKEREYLSNVLKGISSENILYYIYQNRDDVAVVQWFNIEHIKNIAGINRDDDTIKEYMGQIREYLSCQYILDVCHEHLSEMSSYADEGWDLEDLFDLDEEE